MKILVVLSTFLIPVVIFYIVGFGLLQKSNVFDAFSRGAKDGLHTVLKILPTRADDRRRYFACLGLFESFVFGSGKGDGRLVSAGSGTDCCGTDVFCQCGDGTASGFVQTVRAGFV